MTDAPAPILKQIDVPLRPDDAFRLFAERLGDWWPVETHSISAYEKARPRSVTVEGKEGGKITEITHDGKTAEWGNITHWAPGEALEFEWYVGQTPADATHISVTFRSLGDGTRVELAHSGWRVDEMARHDNYQSGWDMVLAPYSTLCAASQTVA